MGRRSDARERLVEAASDLVHRRGYNAVSVADICEDAGLQKGSFYHFFKSKQALVLATLEAHAGRLGDMFDRHLHHDGDARAQLEAWLTGMYGGMAARQAKEGCLLGCPVGNLTQEMAERDPDIQLRLARIFGSWSNRLSATIRRATEQGTLRVSDPDGAAEFLVALVQGSLLLAKATDDLAVLQRISKRALASIEDPA
jgi:TetR/AcrR family transcriptional repressor of nem operon